MEHNAVMLGCHHMIGLSSSIRLGARVHGIHTVTVDYSKYHEYHASSKYISYMKLNGHPRPPKAVDEDINRIFRYKYEDLFAIRDCWRTRQLTDGQVLHKLRLRVAHAFWDVCDSKRCFAFINSIADKGFGKLQRRAGKQVAHRLGQGRVSRYVTA